MMMDSASARIDISGRTGLVAEDYDQVVTVTPKLSSTFPLAPPLRSTRSRSDRDRSHAIA